MSEKAGERFSFPSRKFLETPATQATTETIINHKGTRMIKDGED